MTKWVTKKLGEVCTIHGRIGFRGYTTDDLVEKGYGAITFSPSDIIDFKLNYEDCDYISWAKYEESPEIKIYNGDILFCKTASIGKCAIVDGLKEKATINPQFVVLKNITCDPTYLYYKLISYDFQTQVQGITGGSTIKTMSQEKLGLEPIVFPALPDGTPDLAEQRRIAGILSSADGTIAASEALIEKYRNIKRGLLATLLQPKEGWKKVKLGECCETELGKTLDSGRNTGKYRPYLCALNVLWGKIDLSTIKQMRIEESEKERYLVKRGDLLVCEGGEIGRCAIWNSDEEIYYQNALHRVRFKEEYDATFFMYLLGHYNDLNLIEQYGKGLTIKHLNQSSFRGIPVLIPDLAEQRRIAEILSSVDAKIVAEEKVVEKYKGVKKGLMESMMKEK